MRLENAAFFLPLQEPNLCKDKFRYLNSMEEICRCRFLLHCAFYSKLQ